MDDEDLILISDLPHYLYCPRQCALIHVERQWTESRHTAEGRLLHERVDQPVMEQRKGVRTVTAMPLLSLSLGTTGVADVVEFQRLDAGQTVYPVEYKRGASKAHRADEVQFCAQALCLEAMLDCVVPCGALFYGKKRRREEVRFDEQLRMLTRATIRETREMVHMHRTPTAVYDAKRCDACSLIELCQPRWLQRGRTVTD